MFVLKYFFMFFVILYEVFSESVFLIVHNYFLRIHNENGACLLLFLDPVYLIVLGLLKPRSGCRLDQRWRWHRGFEVFR